MRRCDVLMLSRAINCSRDAASSSFECFGVNATSRLTPPAGERDAEGGFDSRVAGESLEPCPDPFRGGVGCTGGCA